ncbi:MAG: hypothetical protein A2075_06555 [Geobacteraceae bacterium GWC2_58_44]|nr:MAG: hypothetical protein A2075_06555 [Geobacteraceae bacterium GWC2_58_44]HBG05421.1 hypothetical protein [Geobacter sp.]
MKRIRPTIRFSALLLLVLTLHTLAQSFVLPRFESASLQEQAVCTASLTDSDGEEQENTGDRKPPKHSFIDYSTFFSPKHFLPAYNPKVSKLLPHEPFQSLPKIYLEINVPPDSLA